MLAATSTPQCAVHCSAHSPASTFNTLLQEGPIKEHLLEAAHLKRQRRDTDADEGAIGAFLASSGARNGAAIQDPDAPGDDADDGGPSTSKGAAESAAEARKRKYEEEAAYEQLDGEHISAFNMKEERDEGFDEETGELSRKAGEAEDEDDPWWSSLQHKEVRERRCCAID